MEVYEVGRVVDRAALGLEEDRNRLIGDIEVGDLVTVDHGAERRRDAVERQAEIGGAAPVEVHGELWLRRLVGDVGIAEVREVFLDGPGERPGGLEDVLVVRPEQGHLDAGGAAPAQPQRVRAGDPDPGTGNLRQGAAQLPHDLLLAARSLIPRRQRRDGKYAVEVPAPDGGEHTLDLAAVDVGPEDRLDAVRLPIRVGEADAIGPCGEYTNDAAVLGRNQLLVQDAEEPPGEGAECERHGARDHRRVQGQAKRACVEPGQPPAGDGDPTPAGCRTLRQPGREHRHQRQGDERGDADRDREHEAEFPEQAPCRAGQERDRNEDRNEGDGRGDDGEEDLPRAEHGGGAARQTRTPAALDVLEHDNRVVDDQTGGEHEREQGQQVDGEADEPDRRNRADQGQGDRHRRDQRRTQRADEEPDRGHDDCHGDGEGDDDLAHGAANEGRVVGDGRELHLVEAFVEAFHHACHAVGDAHRVRPGLPDDAEADDAPSALADVGLRILRPEEDIGHVADLHRVANGQAAYLVGAGHGGFGAHDELLVLGAEAAGGQVERRVAEHGGDIADRQPEGGQPQGIDHHAQHALTVAEQVDRGNAVDGDQGWDDVLLDDSRERLLAQGFARRGEAHDGAGIGIGLDDGELLHVLGKLPLDPADGLADVAGGGVEVDVGREDDADSEIVLLARRPHLLDAGDARNGPFDESGHLDVDGLRRRAGQVAANGDDGPVDVGQLAHLHAQQRGEPGKRNQQIDHQDQQRPTDRERGQVLADHEGTPDTVTMPAGAWRR